MRSRDLFVVLLRGAGCYLIATTLPTAVWLRLEPGWRWRSAGLANAGLVVLLSLWMLLGAPALVARWHPEGADDPPADDPPADDSPAAGPLAAGPLAGGPRAGGPSTDGPCVGEAPSAAWLRVAERSVA